MKTATKLAFKIVQQPGNSLNREQYIGGAKSVEDIVKELQDNSGRSIQSVSDFVTGSVDDVPSYAELYT